MQHDGRSTLAASRTTHTAGTTSRPVLLNLGCTCSTGCRLFPASPTRHCRTATCCCCCGGALSRRTMVFSWPVGDAMRLRNATFSLLGVLHRWLPGPSTGRVREKRTRRAHGLLRRAVADEICNRTRMQQACGLQVAGAAPDAWDWECGRVLYPGAGPQPTRPAVAINADGAQA